MTFLQEYTTYQKNNGYTYDTGVKISSQTLDDFSSVKHSSTSHKFTANKLALNLDKI